MFQTHTSISILEFSTLVWYTNLDMGSASAILNLPEETFLLKHHYYFFFYYLFNGKGQTDNHNVNAWLIGAAVASEHIS